MNDIFASLSSGAKFKKKGTATGSAVRAPVVAAKKTESSLFHSSSRPHETSSASSGSARKRAASLDSNVNDDDEEIGSEVGSVDGEAHHGNTSTLKRSDGVERIDSVEDANAIRNRLRIKVRGSGSIPHPALTFRDMDLSEEIKSVIIRNIEESDWKEPTPVQMQAIPLMLAQRDVLVAAPTGSGKTAAFTLPVLSKVAQLSKKSRKGIQALMLAPTRELAEQIHREAVRLSAGKRLKICVLKKSIAAAALANNDKSVLDKYDVLIATPMRLVSLITAGAIDLSNVRIVALDEADKLFEIDSGHVDHAQDDVLDLEEAEKGASNDAELSEIKNAFLNQVDTILASCTYEGSGKKKSDRLQRALFSATITPFVTEIASGFLQDPVTVSIGTENAAATTIDQKLLFVGTEEGKLLAIRQLIQKGINPPVLIFLQNKERAKELFRELVYDGINVDIIHADRTQAQREAVIAQFRTGDIWFLICTDLMARGIDFKGVNMVINYDLPTTAVAYIHRIGRTGRAGKRGEAVTLFTEADMPNIRSIANVMKLSGCHVPDWMLQIKQLSTKQKRDLRKHAPERRSINTDSAYDRQKRAKRKLIIEQSKAKKQRTSSADDA